MPAIAVGDFIYLFGGDTPPDTVGTIERIDTRTDTIETLKARITPRYFSCAAAVGEMIYIFGGTTDVNPFWGSSSTVERFDTRTNKVVALTPSPIDLDMACAVEVRGKIYILGNAQPNKEDASKMESLLWIYDPASDQWARGASPAMGLTSKIVAREGVIYAVGGFGDSVGNICAAYDIASNTWRSLPSLPFETKGHDLALIGDSIVTFGDYTDMGRVQRFDLKTQSWERLFFTGFDARRFPSVCVVKDKIYVMGGKIAETGYYLDEV